MSGPAPTPAAPVLTHLSFSRLKALAHSPRALARYLEGRPGTKAMDAGSLLDCLLFTPETLHETFFVWPENGPKKPTYAQRDAKKPASETLVQIEQYDGLIAAAAGKIIVTKSDLADAERLAQAVRDCSTVAEHGLLSPENFTFQDKVEFFHGGFMHRGIRDAHGTRRDGKPVIWDLKRMGGKSGEREVRWQIRNMQYDLQAAIYAWPYDKEGLEVDYYVIAVSDEGDVTPFKIGLDARRQAGIEWARLIRKAHHLNMVGHLDNGPEFWTEPHHEGFFNY